MPLPTLEEREEILAVHTKGKPIGRRRRPARRSRAARPAWPARTSRTSINEAALIAVRGGSDLIRARDFEQARERQTIGRERSSLRLDEDEKRAVAYHEGGHALAAFLEDEADPVYKVTVLPVGMALGVTTQLPIDERHIYLRSWLDAKLKVMLGGRAAELVVLGQPTTGGQHDLVQATKLARAIVREFGMSDALGPVGFFGDQRRSSSARRSPAATSTPSETAEIIDTEVRRILGDALEATVADVHRAAPRPGRDGRRCWSSASRSDRPGGARRRPQRAAPAPARAPARQGQRGQDRRGEGPCGPRRPIPDARRAATSCRASPCRGRRTPLSFLGTTPTRWVW